MSADADTAGAGDGFGLSDLVGRCLAAVLAVAVVAIFVGATVLWTRWVTGFLPGLGYVTTPMCMYVLSIGLIPALGVIHRLWVSGDVAKREEDAKRADRDRLRTTLLHAPSGTGREVHAHDLPEHVLRGESDAELRRRRRAQR
ncbi:hypothetical protein AB0L40_20785 [Patulibacter sp. NPDC049589]|uniref:hypothetical protein n=1 Tax=Patulibacter sp. NPDC049589 TaxID=3154731 RepID=UPI00343F3360